MKKCPTCGQLTDSKFCPECGTDLSAVEEIRVCPNCGYETKSKFCPECGTPIEPLTTAKENESVETAAEEVAAETIANEQSEPKSIQAAGMAAVENKPDTEKKKINKKMIAIIAVAVVAIFALVALLGGNDSSTSETTTSETVEEPTVEEPVVEEPEPEPEPEPIDSSVLFGEFTKEDDYSGLNYDNLARNPDDYEGNKYKGSGRVLQVLESDTEVDVRVAVDDNYDNVIYLVYSPSIVSSRILEDDYVTFYGESKGLYSYTSTMGATITIPMLYVQKIDVD